MVTITRVTNNLNNLPTDDQLRQLLELVETAHPILKPSADEPDHFRCFRNASFFLIAEACRTNELNSRFGPWTFVAACDEWLGAQRIDGRTSFKAFISCCIATGVAHTANYPWNELGLTLGSAVRPNDDWRNILRVGHVPLPTKQQKQRARAASPFSVRRDAGGGR